MKAIIGPYKSYLGPYQLADTIFFWIEKYPENKELDKRWDYRTHEWLGEFFAHGFAKKSKDDGRWEDSRPKTWLYKFLEWVDSKRKRKIVIKTDPWDHWNAEHTFSLIILPVLKDLKKHKHGSPMVDDEDVPEHLRSTSAPPTKNEWDTDGNFHKRFEWVLDEIIWAHEQVVDDKWEQMYYTGEADWRFEPCEDNTNLYKMVDGPNHTLKCDLEGLKKHEERINNALKLFGKYYQSLWD